MGEQGASEVPNPAYLDDSDRSIRSGVCGSLEHRRGGGVVQHRDAVRVRAGGRWRAGSQKNGPRAAAVIPDATRTVGADSRDFELRVFNGGVAVENLAEVLCVAGGRAGDLLCVWIPTQTTEELKPQRA